MPIDNKQAKELKKDFLAYSGGFTPDEAFDEVEKYLEYNCPKYCTQDELQEFFDKWGEEEEAKRKK